MKSLSISFIIPTVSFDNRLIKCLNSLLNQNYDKNNYEIIISHGGKEKSSLPFEEKNVIVKYLDFFDNQARKFAATIYATKDLICFIDSDNLPSSPNWLTNHINPLIMKIYWHLTQNIMVTTLNLQQLIGIFH